MAAIRRGRVEAADVGIALPGQMAVLVEDDALDAGRNALQRCHFHLRHHQNIAGVDRGCRNVGHHSVVGKPGTAKAGAAMKYSRSDTSLIQNIDMSVDDPNAAGRWAKVGG
jgi:hypothetical protein